MSHCGYEYKISYYQQKITYQTKSIGLFMIAW